MEFAKIDKHITTEMLQVLRNDGRSPEIPHTVLYKDGHFNEYNNDPVDGIIFDIIDELDSIIPNTRGGCISDNRSGYFMMYKPSITINSETVRTFDFRVSGTGGRSLMITTDLYAVFMVVYDKNKKIIRDVLIKSTYPDGFRTVTEDGYIKLLNLCVPFLHNDVIRELNTKYDLALIEVII